MTAGYAVIWRSKTFTVFYDGRDWTIDPLTARFYQTWSVARLRALTRRGAEVARCWVNP